MAATTKDVSQSETADALFNGPLLRAEDAARLLSVRPSWVYEAVRDAGCRACALAGTSALRARCSTTGSRQVQQRPSIDIYADRDDRSPSRIAARIRQRCRRRSYGSGRLFERLTRPEGVSWYGSWWAGGTRVKRKIGAKRSPGSAERLTRAQAEKELRKRIENDVIVSASRQAHGGAGTPMSITWSM